MSGTLHREGRSCSGSPTESAGLANGPRFGLTFADNERCLRLTLRANGLTIIAKGSQTARSTHSDKDPAEAGSLVSCYGQRQIRKPGGPGYGVKLPPPKSSRTAGGAASVQMPTLPPLLLKKTWSSAFRVTVAMRVPFR